MKPATRTLHRYAIATAGMTWCLLIAGGMVTSTDSGLAVPDWPLSYGTWFPPMVGGILYEHGHRMVAALVGFMILGLAGWLWKQEPRRWVRRLGYTALGAVVVQAFLGGLTVLLLLPPVVSIAHALLGQTIFCLVVALAYATRPGWQQPPHVLADQGWPSLCALARVTLALAVAQLLLGAIIRHTGLAVTEHIIGAGMLLAAVGWLVRRVLVLPRPLIHSHAWRLAALLALQIVLGLTVFFHRGAAWWRTAHQAAGALVLAQLLILSWEIGDSHRFSPSRRGLRNRWLSPFFELTKPRLSALVLLTTGIGFWLGMRQSAQWLTGLFALIGTWLVVGGANALNQWMERETDAKMQRTRARPLPTGRLSPSQAYRFGWLLMIWGVAWLGLLVNWLSAMLAIAAALTYLLAYTPLKRRTPLCTLMGAIPGAIPPMIGWAAARNALGVEAWALFALLFVWQLPHFLAIAVLFHEDYTRAGMRMLPVMETHGYATARQTALYGLALVPVSLFPGVVGLGGAGYVVGALILSVLFFALAVRTALRRSSQSARQLFLASVIYLPILLGLLGWNKISAHPPLAPAVAHALPQARQVPPFSLIDQEGRTFTHDTLKGKVWVVDFIFTRCAGQCPLLMSRMATLSKAFQGTPMVQFLSVRVDPSYERHARMRAYAAHSGINPERWQLLTGDPRDITQLIREGFRLGIVEGGSVEEPIPHSVRFVLVDQQGAIRGYYDAMEADTLSRLQGDIKWLLAEGSAQ